MLQEDAAEQLHAMFDAERPGHFQGKNKEQPATTYTELGSGLSRASNRCKFFPIYGFHPVVT
jgi:hypothetical protein